MSFIKSAIYGALVGIFFSLFSFINLIPFIGPLIGMFMGACACFVYPMIMIIFGYLLCVITKVKKADYGAAGINLLIYTITSTVIFALINFLTQMLGIGFGVVTGADLLALVVSAGAGIIGLMIAIGFQFLLLLVFGLIGAVVYLVLKK